MKTRRIFTIILLPLLLSIGLTPALLSGGTPDAFALNISGRAYTAPDSDQMVCGDKLCSELDERDTIIVYDDGYYQLVQITPNVYSFGSESAAFSLVVRTNQGIIVVDPVNQNHAETMLQAIRTITNQPITHLIYSHNHWDHIGGGQVFSDIGAKVLSHIDTALWLEENPNPKVVKPYAYWEGDFKEIFLGDTKLELYQFGPSHGEGMTVFYLPDEKIVFLVDIVTPNRVGFTIMPDFSPKGWENTLIEIEKLDFDTAMYAHKKAYGPASEVTEIREYLQDLRVEIMSMMDQGINPMVIPSTIELTEYESFEYYDQWLEMNAWRVLLEMWMGW